MAKNLKFNFEQYLTIFENCLRFMAGDAYAHKKIETGGGIYLLWSHYGRPIVMLASSSGPGSCRETAHFAFDPDYVTMWNEKLQKMFAIQYGGNWHSHHGLGMDHPSRGDVGQIHHLASRCNIPQMVQIILTYEDGDVNASKSTGFCSISRKTSRSLQKPKDAAKEVYPYGKAISGANVKCTKIRVDAYIYTEASKGGSYARIPLKVIHHPNPIRTALGGSEILHIPGGEHYEDFPLDRIVYDKLEPDEASNNVDQSIPAALVKQLDEIPDEIISCAEIYTDKDLILVSLPLLNDCRVCVAYNLGKPLLKIHSVHFVHQQTKATIDITSDVLTDNCKTLALIYKRSKDKVNNKGKRLS